MTREILQAFSILLIAGSMACAGDRANLEDLEDVPEPPQIASMNDAVQESYRRTVADLESLREDRAPAKEIGDAYGRLGMWHQAYLRHDAALTAYRNASRLSPDPRWAYHQARLDQRNGDFEQADRLYLRVLESVPSHLPSQIYRAEIALKTDRLDDAGEFVESALRLDPNSLRALTVRGKVLFAQGDSEGAIRLWRRVLEADPSVSVLDQPIALALRRAGRFDEARAHLDSISERGTAETVDVEVPDPWTQSVLDLQQGARPYMKRGRAAIKAQRYDDAAAAFRRAMEFDPDQMEARLNLSSVYMHLHRFQDAEKELRDALLINPDSLRAKVLLAGALEGRGMVVEAEKTAQAVLAIDPAYADGHDTILRILRARRDFEAVEHHLRRLIELRPEQIRYRNLLALNQSRREQWSAAIKTLDEAIAAFPGSQGLVLRRLRIRLLSCVPALRDTATLLTETTQIRRLASPSLDAQDGWDLETVEVIAMAYASSGRREEAIRWQQAAAEKVERADIAAPWVAVRLRDYRAGGVCETLWAPRERQIRARVVLPEELLR